MSLLLCCPVVRQSSRQQRSSTMVWSMSWTWARWRDWACLVKALTALCWRCSIHSRQLWWLSRWNYWDLCCNDFIETPKAVKDASELHQPRPKMCIHSEIWMCELWNPWWPRNCILILLCIKHKTQISVIRISQKLNPNVAVYKYLLGCCCHC